MAFQLSGKVVALCLDKSTAKAHLCNQGGTASLFLSRLVCHILNLAYKHGITCHPVYIPIHLKGEADYLSQGRLVPEWHLLLHSSGRVSTLRLTEVDLLASSYTNQYQHYSPWKIQYLWELWH